MKCNIANITKLTGSLAEESHYSQYSHQFQQTQFYSSTLLVPRKSGATDRIPLISTTPLPQHVSITGELRSRSTTLYVYVASWKETATQFLNTIELRGAICKIDPPRLTPRGRIITNMIVAAHRSYAQRDVSDYIPVIYFGELYFPVGEPIVVRGRIQSRDFIKGEALSSSSLPNEPWIIKTTIEVVTSNISSSREMKLVVSENDD